LRFSTGSGMATKTDVGSLGFYHSRQGTIVAANNHEDALV
jgi:hypothetical protein